jgi:hypothetical protein
VGTATEAFFGNSRDGETVTEPAATAAESLSESSETVTAIGRKRSHR